MLTNSDGSPRHTSWINTHTGRKFYPLEPDPDEIDIRDIAHALSNVCRYAGHCRFYSVAEHSIKLSLYFDIIAGDQNSAKYALLHDASEAYLGDIPRPLKRLPEFAFYLEAEKVLQGMIYKKFGLSLDMEPDIVGEMDGRMIGSEAPAIFEKRHSDWKQPEPPPGAGFSAWSWNLFPEEVERSFLNRAADWGWL